MPGDAALWLQLNPSWRQELDNFDRQRGVKILDLLAQFGNWFTNEEDLYESGLFWPVDDVYWDTEPEGEEGAATETQVNFHACLRVHPSISNPPVFVLVDAHTADSTSEARWIPLLQQSWNRCQTPRTFVFSSTVGFPSTSAPL